MKRPGDGDHLEAHLLNDGMGHDHSIDCWCEPKRYWIMSQTGLPIFVVEHDDDNFSRAVHLHRRNTDRDWITVLLDSLT